MQRQLPIKLLFIMICIAVVFVTNNFSILSAIGYGQKDGLSDPKKEEDIIGNEAKISLQNQESLKDVQAANLSDKESRGYYSLDSKINDITKKYSAVGMSVEIIRNGRLEWGTSYGYADKEKGIPASKDTVYRIASVSKSITGIVLMTLWDKGQVDLDKDISSYLGFSVKNPYFPDKPITLRSLMTHTSSISDYGTYNDVVDNGLKYPLLKDMLTPGSPSYNSSNFHKYAPASGNYDYSNFGAGIVAAIIESVTGERFSDYARETVFRPLGLDASFLPNDISDINKVANVYSGGALTYGKAEALKENISKLPIGQLYRLAQGNLYISAEDLSKLAVVLMGDGTYSGKRILSKEAVDAMNKVQWTGNSGIHKMDGLGIHITDDIVMGRRLWGHQGRAYGTTAEMFYDINDKTGVIYI